MGGVSVLQTNVPSATKTLFSAEQLFSMYLLNEHVTENTVITWVHRLTNEGDKMANESIFSKFF